MKHHILFLTVPVLLWVATPSSAYAFGISFAYELCTAPIPEIEQRIDAFSNKLAWVRRFESRGSAYRKHVESHARELDEALTKALTASNCTADQRKALAPLQQKFEALFLRNKTAEEAP